MVPDPTDPNRAALVRWRFPGWAFLPGAKVTIAFQVQLEPGTPADQVISDTARASATSAFTCTPDAPDDSTTTITGQLWCTSTAAITSLAGTSVKGAKWTSGDPALGFLSSLTGEVTPVDDPVCPRLVLEGVTYTRYPCVALNYPGQGFDFLLQLVNSSNNAITESR